MSKEILCNLFNDKIIELMSSLISAFPDIEDFKVIRKGTILVGTIDYKNPYKIFRDYVSVKYKEQILKKDETFFLKTINYDVHIQEDYQNKDYWNNFIEQLKKIWVTLDIENKDNIWKYFQVLVALCNKIDTCG